MKYYATCFLIFSFLMGGGHYGGHGKGRPAIGKVSGTIINSLNGDRIKYASVGLISTQNQEVVSGQLSDEQGQFFFYEVPFGQYRLDIKCIGFHTWSSDVFKITKKKKDYYFGDIILEFDPVEANAVEITEEKLAYEFESDKLIYNPSDDIIATSGSAEDVLNKAPMVTVDQDGEVALRGNSNVKILVDGRTNRVELANIAGSNIERVEVITSPSAKYDPEGMAGIINIVLKKGTSDGFNGSLKLNLRHNNYHSIDKMNSFNYYGNYKVGKFNFFSSLGMHQKMGTRLGHRYVSTIYHNNESNSDYIDSLFYDYTDISDRSSMNAKLGMDYFIDDELTFTSELKYSKHNKITTNTQDFFVPDIPSEETIEEEGGDDNYDVELLFMLDKTFDNADRELSIEFNMDQGFDNEINTLLRDDGNLNTEFEDNHSAMDIDLSYMHPFSDLYHMEFGYDGRMTSNLNTMSFELEALGAATNTFDYNRDMHSFFLEYEAHLGKQISIKPSIRYEYIDKKIDFSSTFEGPQNEDSIFDDLIQNAQDDSPYIENFGAFYPNFHLTYKFGGGDNETKYIKDTIVVLSETKSHNKSIQFGLSRRVNRPGGGGRGHGSWQIMPFPRNIYNDQFIFVGNPFLEPEYSTQYDLKYSTPIPTGFASLNIFYHELENKIEWYDDDSYSSGDVLTFRNAEIAYTRGIGLFTVLMGQVLGGTYSSTDVRDSENEDDYELNESSEFFNIYSQIRLPEEFIKIFDFEFGLYWMKMKLPSGSMFGNEGTTWADLGISKKFMNNRLTVSFTIDNLFDSGGFQMQRTKPVDYVLPGYDTAIETSDVLSTRNGRTFKLTLKYQLGKLLDDKKRRHERDDDGGGGMMDMGY